MGRIAGMIVGVGFVCLFAPDSSAYDTPQVLPSLPSLPTPPPQARVAEPSNAAPTAPPADEARRHVYVHIEVGDPVDLEWDGEGAGYNPVCTSPCDQLVPAKGTYRITGTDLRPSKSFELVGDRATLRVAAASQSAYVAGKTFLVIGAVPFGIAGGLLLTAAVFSRFPSDGPDSGPSSSSGPPSAVIDVAIALGVGAAFMAVGIPMMLLNAHTRVSQTSAPAGAAVGTPARWSAARNDTRPEQRAMPAATTLPFLTFDF